MSADYYAQQPNPAYGTTQQPVYGATQQPAYGAPQQPVYGAPQQAAYPHQQQPMYGAAQTTAYAVPPPAAYGQPHVDPEQGVKSPSAAQRYADFMDQEIRRGFVRKVYGILSLQVLTTLAICLLFVLNDSVNRTVRSHREYLWVAYGTTLFCIIAMACCDGVRRSFPMNYIFLSIFTLAESYLVGTISAFYDTRSVVLALGATAIVTVTLTIFAFQTKYDFTRMGGALIAVLIVFIFMGLIAAIFRTPTMQLVYAAIGAVIFSVFIVYDTQLLMGGKHRKYRISPDEYVFAALNIYLDIVNLFIYLLAIFGGRRT